MKRPIPPPFRLPSGDPLLITASEPGTSSDQLQLGTIRRSPDRRTRARQCPAQIGPLLDAYLRYTYIRHANAQHGEIVRRPRRGPCSLPTLRTPLGDRGRLGPLRLAIIWTLSLLRWRSSLASGRAGCLCEGEGGQDMSDIGAFLANGPTTCWARPPASAPGEQW
jgi:hypothetical protein